MMVEVQRRHYLIHILDDPQLARRDERKNSYQGGNRAVCPNDCERGTFLKGGKCSMEGEVWLSGQMLPFNFISSSVLPFSQIRSIYQYLSLTICALPRKSRQYSFSKHLLSVLCVPDARLGPREESNDITKFIECFYLPGILSQRLLMGSPDSWNMLKEVLFYPCFTGKDLEAQKRLSNFEEDIPLVIGGAVRHQTQFSLCKRHASLPWKIWISAEAEPTDTCTISRLKFLSLGTVDVLDHITYYNVCYMHWRLFSICH